jgi:hypothetical protein
MLQERTERQQKNFTAEKKAQGCYSAAESDLVAGHKREEMVRVVETGEEEEVDAEEVEEDRVLFALSSLSLSRAAREEKTNVFGGGNWTAVKVGCGVGSALPLPFSPFAAKTKMFGIAVPFAASALERMNTLRPMAEGRTQRGRSTQQLSRPEERRRREWRS